MAGKLILPAKPALIKPKRGKTIIDDAFQWESKEARAEYDEMVETFRLRNRDFIPTKAEETYHKRMMELKHAHPDRQFTKPNFGAQTRFLMDSSDICIYGGAAGGGKSFAGLLYPLRFVHRPNFRSVMFRRTMPEITDGGALLDISRPLYSGAGGKLNEQTYKWKWMGHNANAPSRVELSGMQYEKDAESYKGTQFALVYFDELTMFTEHQFWYLYSRARTDDDPVNGCPVRAMMRASTNPDPDSFVRQLLDFYIGSDGYAKPELSGVKRWLVMNPNTGIREQFNIREEALERINKLYKDWDEADRPDPVSLSFIPSALKDNPFLDKNKGYRSRLGMQDPVEQERLLRGNWNVKAAAGKLFQPTWVHIVDEHEVPANIETVRAWDIASTEPTKKNKSPDSTAGILMGKCKDNFCWILDSVNEQLNPNDTWELLVSTAKKDGREVEIDVPNDPGAMSGLTFHTLITEKLPDHEIVTSPERGKKTVRFSRFSAKAFQGEQYPDKAQEHLRPVKVLRAVWNTALFNALKGFPDAEHDDDADAISRAFKNLFPEDEGFDMDAFLGD